jgi:hypothetical protein
MSTAIPTSTSVVESTVIRAPLSHVWHHIKLEKFADFWSALKSSELVKGVSDDTDVVKWTFKDGSAVEVKQEEHSVSFTLLLCPNNFGSRSQRREGD